MAESIAPVAEGRAFSLPTTPFATSGRGVYLLAPDLVRLNIDGLALAARLPGSNMIPAGHALRACLALELWSIEPKSHIMSLVTDGGFALFCGLNVIPKKSYLAEYSSRLDHRRTLLLLAAWNEQVTGDALLPAGSFNLCWCAGRLGMPTHRPAGPSSATSSASLLKSPQVVARSSCTFTGGHTFPSSTCLRAAREVCRLPLVGRRHPAADGLNWPIGPGESCPVEILAPGQPFQHRATP